jgi:hypothetical protein
MSSFFYMGADVAFEEKRAWILTVAYRRGLPS